MSDQPPEPSEEELRAALEAELKRITVDDVLLQTTVSLVNVGGRRAGLVPGSEDERDLDQVEAAIDAVGALLPLLEKRGEAAELAPIRDALSRLQMAYTQLRGQEAPGGEGETAEPGAEPAPPPPGAPPAGESGGPPPSSGRLWVPGQ